MAWSPRMTSRDSLAKRIRLVLDTNVYIAASSPGSFIAQFLFATKTSINPYVLYTSPAILQEVETKLTSKLHYPKAKAVEYIKELAEKTILLYPTISVELVERDPDDNKILECALEAKADMIISADKDLLVLKKFENCDIVHPTQLKYIFADLFGDV